MPNERLMAADRAGPRRAHPFAWAAGLPIALLPVLLLPARSFLLDIVRPG